MKVRYGGVDYEWEPGKGILHDYPARARHDGTLGRETARLKRQVEILEGLLIDALDQGQRSA